MAPWRSVASDRHDRPTAPRLGGVEQLPSCCEGSARSRRGAGLGARRGFLGGGLRVELAVTIGLRARTDGDEATFRGRAAVQRAGARAARIGVAALSAAPSGPAAEHGCELHYPALPIELLHLGDGPPVPLALGNPEVRVGVRCN